MISSKQTLVRITPLNKYMKERCKAHGEVMVLLREDIFQGQKAILVESQGKTWRGQTWAGWITPEKGTWEIVSE